MKKTLFVLVVLVAIAIAGTSLASKSPEEIFVIEDKYWETGEDVFSSELGKETSVAVTVPSGTEIRAGCSGTVLVHVVSFDDDDIPFDVITVFQGEIEKKEDVISEVYREERNPMMYMALKIEPRVKDLQKVKKGQVLGVIQSTESDALVKLLGLPDSSRANLHLSFVGEKWWFDPSLLAIDDYKERTMTFCEMAASTNKKKGK